MTELKSIWHTDIHNDIPDFNKTFVELSRSSEGDLVYSTWGHPNYITNNTIKWCYIDDLLALETNLDRTKKQLEIAIDALKDIHCIYTGDQTTKPSTMFGRAVSALNKITALEQKE